MFENDLRRRFERIFGIKKVTFNAPDYEAPEQDCIFIEIGKVTTRISENGARQIARALGAAVVFSQGERLPYGFFLKRIANAIPDDVTPLLFEPEMDMPDSPVRLINLHERRLPFLFLYDSQYDPDKGELTSIELDLSIEE